MLLLLEILVSLPLHCVESHLAASTNPRRKDSMGGGTFDAPVIASRGSRYSLTVLFGSRHHSAVIREHRLPDDFGQGLMGSCRKFYWTCILGSRLAFGVTACFAPNSNLLRSPTRPPSEYRLMKFSFVSSSSITISPMALQSLLCYFCLTFVVLAPFLSSCALAIAHCVIP
jgi:hypothetical protein